MYSSIPGPYAAFAADPYLGAANYSSTMAYNAEQLLSFRFVGGVDTADSSLRFTFWNAAGDTQVSTFDVTLSQAGNYIWTITLDAADNILAPQNGWMEVTGVDGATGKWFLTTTAASVGSQVPVSGDYIHAFEMTTSGVPAPGALALLGLAGLVSRRRR
ncbi:MAG: hypothetical protein O2819_08315 [Planctomycetota bacterium]|nr:hypothetical protein [Planctomycetota bacterium]